MSRTNFFEGVHGAAFSISFRLFGLPVLDELMDGSYQGAGGRGKEMYEIVQAALVTVVYAEIFFAESMYDGGSSCVEFGQGKDCGFHLHGAEGRAETNKCIIDGGTGIMTEDGHFFVPLIKQLFLKRKMRLARDVQREIRLSEIDERPESGHVDISRSHTCQWSLA